uniref:Mitochondrial inner membrane protease ATP23 n=1 Tax=Cyprinus carpio carpio TaxID=630221 RepID=A0A8C1BA83_CYPCA
MRHTASFFTVLHYYIQFIKTDTSHVRIVTGRSAEALMPPPLRSSCARTTSMKRVVTHKLIHAFDHCRARVDWFNSFRHLACSEIRAVSLSGDCSFVNEISRFNFGLKEHHQGVCSGSELPGVTRVCRGSRGAAGGHEGLLEDRGVTAEPSLNSELVLDSVLL